MNKTISIIVIALVLIGGYYLLNKAQEPQTNEPIRIGAVLSLSGFAAQDGESMKKGIELAKVDLQKRGVDVEVIYQDDKTEPKDTVSAINALAVQNVLAIIGPTWSYLGDAGVPVADRLRIVLVQPADTSEYVSARSRYNFFTIMKVERLTPTLTEWLKQNDVKTIAIIRDQGAWYETVGKAVEKAAKEAEAKIILNETMQLGKEADTMPTLIAKVKSLSPDLLFTELDDDKGIIIMLKKIREQKISSDIMSVTTSVGRVLAENDLTSGLINNLYVISPKLSEEFRTKFLSAYNQEPTAYADRAYDSLMLLVDAIQKRGNTPLDEYLQNKTNYKGIAGQYKFDENGDIEGGDWIIQTLKK